MTSGLLLMAVAGMFLLVVALAWKSREARVEDYDEPEIPEFQPGEVRLAKRITADQIKWEV